MILTVNIPKRVQKITNGDMIKAMFPNGYVEIKDLKVTMNLNGSALLAFPLKWWNKPYKIEESEDKG